MVENQDTGMVAVWTEQEIQLSQIPTHYTNPDLQ